MYQKDHGVFFMGDLSNKNVTSNYNPSDIIPPGEERYSYFPNPYLHKYRYPLKGCIYYKLSYYNSIENKRDTIRSVYIYTQKNINGKTDYGIINSAPISTYDSVRTALQSHNLW